MEAEHGPSGRRRRYDVGMPKSKAYSNPLPSIADEQRYGTKCHELRAKIREIERENQNIQLKILQSKKNVSRLRIERAVLYEALATVSASAFKAKGIIVPPEAQPSTCNAPLSALNPTPAPSIPSPHNGYHPQSIPPPSRAYNDPPQAANNHGQVPNRSFNRSTEPVPINGITGLLNSNVNNTNSHHGPPPPIPHSQYPQNLPAQTQVPSHNNSRMTTTNAHQLAPISADPAASARFSSASDSPTAPNNHFQQQHQLGARSMPVSAHHHHSRYPSPHVHHHHHHHRHPSEHARSNPASAAVLPSLHPHPPTSQPLLNGNGPAPRVEGRVEAEGAEEEAEGEDDDGEEEEEEGEEEEVEGSTKDGSTSIRQVDDEMEIDAECEDEE